MQKTRIVCNNYDGIIPKKNWLDVSSNLGCIKQSRSFINEWFEYVKWLQETTKICTGMDRKWQRKKINRRDENYAGCDFIVKKKWISVAIYKAKGGKISIRKGTEMWSSKCLCETYCLYFCGLDIRLTNWGKSYPVILVPLLTC